MASIFQDLELVEEVLADVVGFANGQSISGTAHLGGSVYTTSIIVLPNGPASPYTAFSGSFWALFTEAFALGAAAATGGSIQIAVKENKTWYGLTLTPQSNVSIQVNQA